MMAEWSKAPDSSSGSESCVGSNPTHSTKISFAFFFYYLIEINWQYHQQIVCNSLLTELDFRCQENRNRNRNSKKGQKSDWRSCVSCEKSANKKFLIWLNLLSSFICLVRFIWLLSYKICLNFIDLLILTVIFNEKYQELAHFNII